MTAHNITTYATAGGWTWTCHCGWEGRGSAAPTQTAAYAYGERHIRHAKREPIRFTRVEMEAARLQIQLLTELGREVDPRLHIIANGETHP